VKRIDNQLVADSCSKRLADGYHVDSRLLHESKLGHTYSITIEDQETFLSLIWQERDDSRLLTPHDQPRTLRDVAMRIIDGQHTFSSLACDLGRPRDQHRPDWFQKCIPIAESFSYDAFGPVALVPATDGERRQSPNGTFYIYDGIHKTLVLSTLLLNRTLSFRPLDAILLIPRR
jgi:hypothetical protein